MKTILIALAASFLATFSISSANESSLRIDYSRLKDDLKSDLMREIPDVSTSRKSDYFEALEKEEAAKEGVKAAEKVLGEIKTAQALIGHAKNHWIKKADQGIANAKEALKNAKTGAEREKAKADLAKWEENREAGVEALKERTAKWEAVKDDLPKAQGALQAAREALAQASQNVVETTKELGLDAFLSSDDLDAKLARYIVLKEATPAALAEYAAESRAHEAQVEAFLNNDELLVQLMVADGPRKARRAEHPDYPRMLEIYNSIQNASDKASDGALQRLALAVALEHAAPHKLRAAKADTDAPEHVDPLKRYLHFEKAYLDGELDPHFGNLRVWDMRMVVDGEEPEEILAWGREMLRNYRPDHITTSDHRWRYVGLVRSDIRYGSQDNKYDRDDLQFFQNILMNGGICGRRAFIGRFILRAFGNPTTARPQSGHAALVRWTPDGWVPVLGGGWGAGWTKTPYDRDKDFLATTQARALGDEYLQVKRAHWVGDLLDEPRVYGLLNNRKAPEFWNGLALNTQRALIADAQALDAVGEELGEANVSDVEYAIDTAEVTDADREITVNDKGLITIPAAATSEPKSSKGKVIFIPSVLGGLQLHYKRTGGATDFEYTINAPEAGSYALIGKVVTPSWKQNLVLSVNGEANVAEIPLPHTVGMWDYTEPVHINLKRGKNVLRFSHKTEGYSKGFSIKEFQLAPVPEHARVR
ncbi:hypothetical protein DDZ13_11370 [Coraliomargarita sinensis]|uniref:CBM6 domain-containing protein n=1 Tax=Coraliomargarita sinensis TaxID=2174842 RepID=A0A317ZH64_9BACT|nr:hypothetical protein [Coraliomargarita sinensis]PXA03573.1 hypothetical protein DDZ13_11370 [Coraliomargarita sinensis]